MYHYAEPQRAEHPHSRQFFDEGAHSFTHYQSSPLSSYYSEVHPRQSQHHLMSHPSLPSDSTLPTTSHSYEDSNPTTSYWHHETAGHPLFQGIVSMHYLLGHGSTSQNSNPWLESDEDGIPYYRSELLFPHHAGHGLPPLSVSPTPQRPSAVRISGDSSLQSWSDLPQRDSRVPTSSSTKVTDTAKPPPTIKPSTPPSVSKSSLAQASVKARDVPILPISFSEQKQRACPEGERPDPYAADFIKQHLGEYQWHIFTTRLAENRRNGCRPRSRSNLKAQRKADGDTANGETNGNVNSPAASVVDFLVKVEVVKNVLRRFVPHPYNPLKAMTHPFPSVPKGQVTLTRSTVLSLSGWSNTQFAYWARRAEALSVLSTKDKRLYAIASLLEKRLLEEGVTLPVSIEESSDRWTGTGNGSAPMHHDDRSSSSSSSPLPLSSSPGTVQLETTYDDGWSDEVFEADPDRWVRTSVTGKGLDAIVDEVKRRTGVSPFLRGKHSCLDPFVSTKPNLRAHVIPNVCDQEELTAEKDPQVYMPTFRAESYIHDTTISSGLPNEYSADPISFQQQQQHKYAVKLEGQDDPCASLFLSQSYTSPSSFSPDRRGLSSLLQGYTSNIESPTSTANTAAPNGIADPSSALGLNLNSCYTPFPAHLGQPSSDQYRQDRRPKRKREDDSPGPTKSETFPSQLQYPV